ncbi:TIGR03067 domain-containing protein [Blastopirellula sp. J2-11]|uniref:TIGR03067 domain-containing protein n=1 Tax=Blastopirellula sp. J2-11 TaxID=2943192 RepID=UPI0021CA65EC|nr:TIGR03067 domain-containing protein [Blastopirellula sp. J2-11]UUO05070.1 TIGR03067 domain-containing protein [Blastopirellula sp. J2-11]
MNSRFTLSLVFALCLSVAGVRAEEESSEKSQLQGVWILSQGEANGKSLNQLLKDRGLGGLQIKFSDDLMTMTGFGGPDHKWKFSLLPMNQPQAIRLVAIETQGKTPQGTTLTGIYAIEKDVLKLCLPADSTVDPPKKFEAPSGSRYSMLTLKRQSKEDESRAEP